jgi:hypothetical protein
MKQHLNEIKRMQQLAGLNEAFINAPKEALRVTTKSYKNVNADIIDEFISHDNEYGSRSSEFNDTLQNVVEELKENIYNLYSDFYKFSDIYRFSDGVINEVFEDTLTKDIVLTLVDYYNKNGNQELLEYILDAQQKAQPNVDDLYIENNNIINPNDGELITLTEIRKDIEEVLLPFVTLWNELGTGSFTILKGSYIGETYLIEAEEDGIQYIEPLFDEGFDKVLSTFESNGFMTIDQEAYDDNVEVF